MSAPLESRRETLAPPLPGWPQQPDRDDRDPVVYVPDAYGEGMVAIRRSQVQPTAPTQARDLAPLPLLDPTAQRLLGAGLGGGACAAGLGWGVGQALTPLAGVSTGSFMWIAIAFVAWKAAPAMGRKTINNTTHNTSMHVTNRNRWFGKSTTST
ncbi:hypothetical protein [Streptomyces noursei]|uniref:hypothetical protein n=1 Tax=Streptomyces noursei TaxID=1971 RepID=UPI00167B4F8E|nr:hypothetical protein [Streptomyces noursei]MCZ1013968.1 hypothetical protein [Streptomyces noursei]GGX40515.1 hypothetical protein GCM10010341_73050 [Streptomyces noursei]